MNTGFTTRLTHLLAIKNYSQYRFAKAAAIPPTTLSNFMVGRREPKLSTLIQILSVFSRDEAWWLLTGDGPYTITLSTGGGVNVDGGVVIEKGAKDEQEGDITLQQSKQNPPSRPIWHSFR